MNLKLDLNSLFKRKAKNPEQEDFQANPSEQSQKAKKVLIFVKSNLLVFVLSASSITAFVAAVIFSSDLYSKNEEKAKEIAVKIEGLTKLERTAVSIQIPGNDPVTGTLTVNRKLVETVKSRMEQDPTNGTSTGDSVTIAAIQHNQGSHRPVLSLRFKPSDESKRRVVRLDMHEKLLSSYGDLLKKCRATLPPSEEDVLVELQRAKLRFILTELGQSIDAKRTPEQESKLLADLTNRRLAAYQNASMNFGLYLDAQDLGAPTAPIAEDSFDKIVVSLWNMQWKYWIAEDVVLACLELNAGQPIAQAPVKRISNMTFRIPYGAVVVSEGEASQPTEGADTGAENNPTSQGAPIDRNAIVPMSSYAFSSIKGWASNQLYDVVQTNVTLVIETSKIPLVTDAFAKKNFIVIADVRISAIDPFVAIRSGYYYGLNPVSLVVLKLESAWLREWTGPLMPDSVRAQLGTTGQVQGLTESSGTQSENSIDPPR